MKERLLTICGQYKQTTSEKIPVLILKGEWFKDAGFGIGDRVSISENNRKLIIENKGFGFGKPYASKTKKKGKKRTQPTE